MAQHRLADARGTDEEAGAATIPHQPSAGGAGTLEAATARAAHPVVRFLKALGPGLITGASDDDPSGIGTYATAGASLGFAQMNCTAAIIGKVKRAVHKVAKPSDAPAFV